MRCVLLVCLFFGSFNAQSQVVKTIISSSTETVDTTTYKNAYLEIVSETYVTKEGKNMRLLEHFKNVSDHKLINSERVYEVVRHFDYTTEAGEACVVYQVYDSKAGNPSDQFNIALWKDGSFVLYNYKGNSAVSYDGNLKY